MTPTQKRIVVIGYTNHANVKGERTISPDRIRFGSTKWHKEEQWLVDAWDFGKEAARTFAMKDISKWTPFAG